PKAFILVLDALLQKDDYRAAMALLMTWLNQVEQEPLEDGVYSFHVLALRCIMGSTTTADWSLIRKFFDYLEANAEDQWEIPEWELAEREDLGEEKESPYAAAYEGMTYQDTADDETEGAVANGGGPPPDLDFDREGARVGKRL